jgi:hypothetical protein
MAATYYELLKEDGDKLLLETGDNLLLENYFYDSKVLGSKYCIITTPEPIEKSLQYAMVKSYGIQKDMTYSVFAWIKKTLKYCVEAIAPVITKSMIYELDNIHPVSRAFRYCILTIVSITKGLSYYIKNVHAITKGLIYKVNPVIKKQKSLQYCLLIVDNLIQKVLGYFIVNIHAITKALRYIIYRSGVITKTLEYAIEVPRGIDLEIDMFKADFELELRRDDFEIDLGNGDIEVDLPGDDQTIDLI